MLLHLKKLLLNLDIRMRLLEDEAVLVGKHNKTGYLLLEHKVQDLRRTWQEIISNV